MLEFWQTLQLIFEGRKKCFIRLAPCISFNTSLDQTGALDQETLTEGEGSVWLWLTSLLR
jgi:hypothetical protein